jgi:hypothetical protein
MRLARQSSEKYLQTFKARFEPSCRDDLRPGAERLIGRQRKWQYVWVIEDGPCSGQWACALISPEPAPFAWAPESDLKPKNAWARGYRRWASWLRKV